METEVININHQIVSQDIIDILNQIYDPEIDFSIYELGLVYKVDINYKEINILMTLTTVNCPEAQSLPEEIRTEIQLKFPNLKVNVEVTFEPAWTVDNMSDEVKLRLGLL